MIYDSDRDFRDLKGMFCPRCGSTLVIKDGIVNPTECWYEYFRCGYRWIGKI